MAEEPKYPLKVYEWYED